MAIDVKRYIVPCVVGLAPALLVALTWSPAGDWTSMQLLVRNFVAPVIGAELLVILVAAREGLLKSIPGWNWSRPALIAIVILLAIAVATAYFAPLRFKAAYLTGYWIIHGLFGVSILFLCNRLFQPLDLVRAYMVGFAAFACLFFLYLLQIPDWARFDWKNHFMTFSHIRHPGYYLAAIAAISTGVMAIAESRREWVLAFSCSTLAIGMALWTGSRGAVLAVAAAMAIGLVLSPGFRNLRGLGGGLASMLVAAAVTSQLPAPHPMMGFSRMVGATTGGNATTGRTELWEIAAKAIMERPLFGYGEGQMREVATFSVMVHPHNVVLQMLLAWGIVGLACVATLALAYGRRALPTVRTGNGAIVPAFLAMTALAVMSLYDGSLFHPLPQSIFVACAAIIASRWPSARTGRDYPRAGGEDAQGKDMVESRVQHR